MQIFIILYILFAALVVKVKSSASGSTDQDVSESSCKSSSSSNNCNSFLRDLSGNVLVYASIENGPSDGLGAKMAGLDMMQGLDHGAKLSTTPPKFKLERDHICVRLENHMTKYLGVLEADRKLEICVCDGSSAQKIHVTIVMGMYLYVSAIGRQLGYLERRTDEYGSGIFIKPIRMEDFWRLNGSRCAWYIDPEYIASMIGDVIYYCSVFYRQIGAPIKTKNQFYLNLNDGKIILDGAVQTPSKNLERLVFDDENRLCTTGLREPRCVDFKFDADEDRSIRLGFTRPESGYRFVVLNKGENAESLICIHGTAIYQLGLVGHPRQLFFLRNNNLATIPFIDNQIFVSNKHYNLFGVDPGYYSIVKIRLFQSEELSAIHNAQATNHESMLYGDGDEDSHLYSQTNQKSDFLVSPFGIQVMKGHRAGNFIRTKENGWLCQDISKYKTSKVRRYYIIKEIANTTPRSLFFDVLSNHDAVLKSEDAEILVYDPQNSMEQLLRYEELKSDNFPMLFDGVGRIKCLIPVKVKINRNESKLRWHLHFLRLPFIDGDKMIIKKSSNCHSPYFIYFRILKGRYLVSSRDISDTEDIGDGIYDATGVHLFWDQDRNFIDHNLNGNSDCMEKPDRTKKVAWDISFESPEQYLEMIHLFRFDPIALNHDNEIELSTDTPIKPDTRLYFHKILGITDHYHREHGLGTLEDSELEFAERYDSMVLCFKRHPKYCVSVLESKNSHLIMLLFSRVDYSSHIKGIHRGISQFVVFSDPLASGDNVRTVVIDGLCHHHMGCMLSNMKYKLLIRNHRLILIKSELNENDLEDPAAIPAFINPCGVQVHASRSNIYAEYLALDRNLRPFPVQYAEGVKNIGLDVGGIPILCSYDDKRAIASFTQPHKSFIICRLISGAVYQVKKLKNSDLIIFRSFMLLSPINTVESRSLFYNVRTGDSSFLLGMHVDLATENMGGVGMISSASRVYSEVGINSERLIVFQRMESTSNRGQFRRYHYLGYDRENGQNRFYMVPYAANRGYSRIGRGDHDEMHITKCLLGHSIHEVFRKVWVRDVAIRKLKSLLCMESAQGASIDMVSRDSFSRNTGLVHDLLVLVTYDHQSIASSGQSFIPVTSHTKLFVHPELGIISIPGGTNNNNLLHGIPINFSGKRFSTANNGLFLNFEPFRAKEVIISFCPIWTEIILTCNQKEQEEKKAEIMDDSLACIISGVIYKLILVKQDDKKTDLHFLALQMMSMDEISHLLDPKNPQALYFDTFSSSILAENTMTAIPIIPGVMVIQPEFGTLCIDDLGHVSIEKDGYDIDKDISNLSYNEDINSWECIRGDGATFKVAKLKNSNAMTFLPLGTSGGIKVD